MPTPYPGTHEAGIGHEANLAFTAGPRIIDPSLPGAVHDPHYAVTVVTVFLAAAVFNFVGLSPAALCIIRRVMGITSVGAVYFVTIELFQEEMGEAPTTGWLAGEVVVDDIEVAAVEGMAGTQSIAVGLYDPMTGQRLPVLGPDGAVLDDGIQVPLP